MLSNKKRYLFMGIILIIILIILVLFCYLQKVIYYLDLNGSDDIVIYQNTQYIEYGYEAYDSKGRKYNDSVIINGYVDTNTVGEYTLTYKFNDIVKRRVINVISEDSDRTFLILKGNSMVFVPLGKEYVDEEYIVLDSKYSFDLIKERVLVDNNVDINKAGTYRVIYSG